MMGPAMVTSGEKAEATVKRGGRAKLLLFGGIGLVVLLGGGAAAAWFGGLLD